MSETPNTASPQRHLLSADDGYKALISQRNELRQSMLVNKRALSEAEKAYTLYTTVCGGAITGAFTFLAVFSFALALPVIAMGALSIFTGYKVFKLHFALDGLRENAESSQIHYENARDSLRDYVFTRLQEETLAAKTAPQQSLSCENAKTSAQQWQDKIRQDALQPAVNQIH